MYRFVIFPLYTPPKASSSLSKVQPKHNQFVPSNSDSKSPFTMISLQQNPMVLTISITSTRQSILVKVTRNPCIEVVANEQIDNNVTG